VICILVVLAAGLVSAAIIRRHHHDTVNSLGSNRVAATPKVNIPAVYVTSASTKPSPVLSILGTGKAIYATSGCHGPTGVLGTTSGGFKWTAIASPALHILRAQIVDATHAWVVGGDSACHPTYYSISATSGGWVPSAKIGSIWFVVRNGIHIPNGRTSTPCGTTTPTPVALAPSGSRRALVVCAKGVFRTDSGGRNWNPTGAVPYGHPVNVALTGGGHGLLLLDGSTGCKGLRVARTSNDGKSWQSGSCLDELKPPAGVALLSTGAGLATVGTSSTYQTTDFGVTWQLSGSPQGATS
jgi:hypothetical protein